jgi:AcrR family transcriptional regulator
MATESVRGAKSKNPAKPAARKPSRPAARPAAKDKSRPAPRKSPRPPARTRLLLDERRAQLIELGIDVFAKSAYDEVHIESLAQKAGISKGLLYHYFPTKRDFYIATLRGAAERLLRETEVNTALPPPERLASGLHGYLQFVERYASAYVALMRGGVGFDTEAAAIIEETRGAYMTRLLAGLSEVLPPARTAELVGQKPPRISPLLRIALRGFIGFVEATSLEWAVARDVPRGELVGLLVQVLLSTIQGVLAPMPVS